MGEAGQVPQLAGLGEGHTDIATGVQLQDKIHVGNVWYEARLDHAFVQNGAAGHAQLVDKTIGDPHQTKGDGE